jgi:hypothetical protein
MNTICLMEFDKNKRVFCFLREVKLSSVPTSGDKIGLDIDDIGYVFKVYDVHYAEHAKTDVNIIRLSTITDYNSSGFPDIN